jgi:hypothetical protein
MRHSSALAARQRRSFAPPLAFGGAHTPSRRLTLVFIAPRFPQSPRAPAEALFSAEALPPLLRLLRCADASVRLPFTHAPYRCFLIDPALLAHQAAEAACALLGQCRRRSACQDALAAAGGIAALAALLSCGSQRCASAALLALGAAATPPRAAGAASHALGAAAAAAVAAAGGFECAPAGRLAAAAVAAAAAAGAPGEPAAQAAAASAMAMLLPLLAPPRALAPPALAVLAALFAVGPPAAAAAAAADAALVPAACAALTASPGSADGDAPEAHAGALRCLAAACATPKGARAAADAGAAPLLATLLAASQPPMVRGAAATCAAALSRCVRVLQGALSDANIAAPLLALALDPAAAADARAAAASALANCCSPYSPQLRRCVVSSPGAVAALGGLAADVAVPAPLRTGAAAALGRLWLEASPAEAEALATALPWRTGLVPLLTSPQLPRLAAAAAAAARNALHGGPPAVAAAAARAGGVAPLAAALVEGLQAADGASASMSDGVSDDDDVAELRTQLLYALANAAVGGEGAKNALVAAGVAPALAAALHRGPPGARVASAWCATNLAWTCPPHAAPVEAMAAAAARTEALTAAGVADALQAVARGAPPQQRADGSPAAAADDARLRARAALEQMGRAAARQEASPDGGTDAHMQEA